MKANSAKGVGKMKKRRDSSFSFPDEVLEHVLLFVDSIKDRSTVSLVRKAWYRAKAWSRRKVFIGNYYSVSLEILVMRFPKITGITLKGKKPTEMDPTEKRRMEESENLSFKTFGGTMSGFVGGGRLGSCGGQFVRCAHSAFLHQFPFSLAHHL